MKFFAKYCAPCVRTLPAAQRVHLAHPDVAFLGVDEDDSEETARALVATYALSFPVILDRDNVLSGRFRVRELPKVFVVDGHGVIRWVGGADATEEQLESAIRDAT